MRINLYIPWIIFSFINVWKISILQLAEQTKHIKALIMVTKTVWLLRNLVLIRLIVMKFWVTRSIISPEPRKGD